jgi:hypothetical protein
MKHCFKSVYALIATAIFATAPGHANDEKNLVVSIQTDSINLSGTDITSLAVGESKTIETESGRYIDLLRTVDGVEIYIDGELVDPHLTHDPESEFHIISKHVEITCDDELENSCEKHVVIHTKDDGETSIQSVEEDDGTFVHEEIEITCTDDGDETDCAKHVVWITEGDEAETDIELLHEEHLDGKGHKLIVITSKTDSND